MNYIQPIKTISSDDLYNNYPLSSYFANSISCQPHLSLKVSSLEELLFQDPGLQVSEELDGNFLSLSCFSSNFILKENTIYYYDSESRTYFNLEEIPYSDIIVSSILYVVKKHDLDCWWAVSKLLLKSFFKDKLSFYLKKENLLLKYRENFILGLIDSFEEIELTKSCGLLTKNKKYSKKRILNILTLLDVNESEALSLIDKYQSISSDSYVIIDFLNDLLK